MTLDETEEHLQQLAGHFTTDGKTLRPRIGYTPTEEDMLAVDALKAHNMAYESTPMDVRLEDEWMHTLTGRVGTIELLDGIFSK